MKKNLMLSLVFGLSIALFSCGSGDSPESCAKKYCELHAKYDAAVEGSEKDAAKQAMNDYENKLESAHKGDEAFFKAFEEEVEKNCKAG